MSTTAIKGVEMRFSENRLYIDSYVKCANCGNLIYVQLEEDARKMVVHDSETYCSQSCVDWKLDRDRRWANKEPK